MEPWRTLVDAYQQEDRLLRELIAGVPRHLRDTATEAACSCKEVLAHLAYWDDFTVRFFESKTDPAARAPEAPRDFDGEDRQAIADLQNLPFGEILARYLEATGAVCAFLKERWERMTPRQRRDFWVPLQHRRNHRFALARSLAAVEEKQSLASGA